MALLGLVPSLHLSQSVYVIQDYPPAIDAVLFPSAFISGDEAAGKNIRTHRT
jgi:hypothetical protein